MPEVRQFRTSLAVGFPDGTLPERFAGYRAREHRALARQPEFPYEDAQFDVVIFEASCVTVAYVREAHRVLRKNGLLVFTVPERTAKQEGFTIPDIYAVVRNGFNIITVERPRWWHFGRQGRTLTICAQKKFWKNYVGYARGSGLALSPFHNSKS